MFKYIFKKVFALILFALAMVLIPLAIPFVVLVATIAGAFHMIAHSDEYGGPKTAIFVFILGFAAFFGAFSYAEEISNWIYNSAFGLPAIFCGITIVGGWYLRSFAIEEEANYYMDDSVNTFTKFHPQLIMASGIIRLVVEVAFCFFAEYVAPYSVILNIASGIGIFLFAISIVMYVVRTAHVYTQNK